MNTFSSIFIEIDWKVAFSGLAFFTSLISIKLSIDNAKNDKHHKQVEQILKKNQLITTIDNKLYHAWDLMGGNIETQLVAKYASRTNLNQAKRLIEECTKLKVDYAPCYLHMGLYYYGLWKLSECNPKDLEKAEAAYRKAIKLDPKYVNAYSNLGNILYKMKRLEEAEVTHRKAISLDPEYVNAYSNLGNALYEMKRLEEAEVAHRKAIKLDPEHVNAHNNLGNTLCEMNRFEEAEVIFRKAIKLDPENVKAHSNLGYTLNVIERLEEAKVAHQEMIKFSKPKGEE